MKNKKIFLMLALIVLTLVLSGCLGSTEIKLSNCAYSKSNNYLSESNGVYYATKYEKYGGFFALLEIGDELAIKSWRVFVGGVQANGNPDGVLSGNAEIWIPVKTNAGTIILQSKKEYNVNIEVYSSTGYANKVGSVSFKVNTGGLPNPDPISVENITDILTKYGATYVNTVNDVPKECSSYGLKSTEASIPACLALSQLGKTETNCVRFFKDVYKWSKGVELDKFYSAFDSYPHYTSKTANTSSLDTSKVYMMSQYIGKINGKDTGHASIVYYNNTDKTWYAVGGNISKIVQNYTVQDTLKKCANGWQYYSFREF